MGGEIGTTSIRPAPGAAGFSLIELLVAIAVVAVLAVGAGLAAGPRRDAAGGDMARFHAAWEMQRALAIEGHAMRGLRIGPEGFAPAAWRMGTAGPGWQPAGGGRAWRGAVAFSPGRIAPQGEPEVVFLPGGRSSAFSIRFDGRGSGGGRCESDGWTGLTCG